MVNFERTYEKEQIARETWSQRLHPLSPRDEVDVMGRFPREEAENYYKVKSVQYRVSAESFRQKNSWHIHEVNDDEWGEAMERCFLLLINRAEFRVAF